MIVLDHPLVQALRSLQIYDELKGDNENRHLLVKAMDALGEELGYVCTGVPDGRNEDGSVAFYAHDGDTCPIHEWLVPDDHPGKE